MHSDIVFNYMVKYFLLGLVLAPLHLAQTASLSFFIITTSFSCHHLLSLVASGGALTAQVSQSSCFLLLCLVPQWYLAAKRNECNEHPAHLFEVLGWSLLSVHL